MRHALDVTQMSIDSTLSQDADLVSSLDLNHVRFAGMKDSLNLTTDVVRAPAKPSLAPELRLMSQSPHSSRRNQNYGLLSTF